MSFNSTIGNGYNYSQYTSPRTGKKIVTHIYKKPSTETLALCLSTQRADLRSAELMPAGVSMSRVKVKVNCAFFTVDRPTGENKQDFIGVFRTGGKLYADWNGARTISDPVLTARFQGSYRSYPLFCINGTTSEIHWCGYINEFRNLYSKYSTIISVGAALVYHGNNVFTSGIKDTAQQMQIAPSKCTTKSDNFHYNINIGDPGNEARRTMLGMNQSGVVYLVVTEGKTDAEDGAEIMKSLGCYNAAFLDGGLSSEMYTLDTSTASYVTRAESPRLKATALVVYK